LIPIVIEMGCEVIDGGVLIKIVGGVCAVGAKVE
jgi:hypothetical protein